jgi:hypothetical protein
MNFVSKPQNPRAYFGVTHKNNTGKVIKFFYLKFFQCKEIRYDVSCFYYFIFCHEGTKAERSTKESLRVTLCLSALVAHESLKK